MGLTPSLSVKVEGLYLLFNQYKSLANLEEGCFPCQLSDPAGGPIPYLDSRENFFSIDDGFVFCLGANWRLAGGGA